nr:hypothetical protein [Nocardioides marmorisolisilvae]
MSDVVVALVLSAGEPVYAVAAASPLTNPLVVAVKDGFAAP